LSVASAAKLRIEILEAELQRSLEKSSPSDKSLRPAIKPLAPITVSEESEHEVDSTAALTYELEGLKEMYLAAEEFSERL